MIEAVVSLVGAGPGDPELISVKGLKRVQQADVLVYDRLVHPELVRCTRASCERIYVGKRKQLHTYHQSAINELLISHGRKGKRVVRLKGGDPFIFGRGGEELDALLSAEVPVEVVPGISAGLGAASSLGLALTHRDFAQAVTFVTAHRKSGRMKLDWPLVTRPGQTVVFYMGYTVLDELVHGLLERGVAPTRTLSVVSAATRASERCYSVPLANAVNAIPADLAAPVLVILHDTPLRLTERVANGDQAADSVERASAGG